MSLPLGPAHLPCAQQNAARRCPPGSTSTPAACSFGSSHSQLVRVTLGSSYLRGVQAASRDTRPNSAQIASCRTRCACRSVLRALGLCSQALGLVATPGCSCTPAGMFAPRNSSELSHFLLSAGARLVARAPARPQAAASGGALGLQANLFGRLIRVVRSYANAIGAPGASQSTL